MRTRSLAVLALVVGTVAPATPARATPVTGPDGFRCGLVTVGLPGIGTTPPGPPAHSPVRFGGPLVVTDPAVGLTSGRLYCSVELGAPASHGRYTRARVSSGFGVVVLDPIVEEWFAEPSPAEQVFLCSEFVYTTGERFYWDGSAAEWSTSSAVDCERATRIGAGAGAVSEPLDPVVCPILAQVPVVPQSLQNLWGCARDGDGPLVASYVVLPGLL